jgi:hypothetical protein
VTESNIKPIVLAVGVVLATYLTWEMRSLILPLTVSGLLAYVCRPLVTGLERLNVPRGIAIGLLLTGFLFACLVILVGVQAIVPSEHQFIELKVHALYALNDRYKAVMGLDHSPTIGNRLYRLVHSDVDPLMDHVNEVLALSPKEHADFVASHARSGVESASDQLLTEYHTNLATRAASRRAGGPWMSAREAAQTRLSAKVGQSLCDRHLPCSAACSRPGSSPLWCFSFCYGIRARLNAVF